MGNEASAIDEVTVGLKGGSFILASDNAPTSHTIDWTGEESYYYTGNPNNWVQFGTNSSGQLLYWRIIRINGNGSTRMIYQGTSTNSTGSGTQIGTSAFNSSASNKTYVGLVYDGTSQHGSGQLSTIMTTLNNWYNSHIVNYEVDYIDTGTGFCSDRTMATGYNWTSSTVYYAPYDRQSNGIFECNELDILSQDNGKLPNPIGLLTSDEYVLAGSRNSYLNVRLTYWMMSPSYHYNNTASVFRVSSDGILAGNGVILTYGVRPVINLRSDVSITGTGTVDDPFKVVGA